MDFKKEFGNILRESEIKNKKVAINYDPVIFEASDKLKKDIKDILKNDKKAKKMKTAAVKDKDKVHDYLDYIYFSYEQEIEDLSKTHKVDFDDIAKSFLEV